VQCGPFADETANGPFTLHYLLFLGNSYNIRPMEFAVIQTGGKQYKVSKGTTVSIEKIKGEYTKGDKLSFDKVLLVDDGKDTTIGTPYITGAKVDAEIVEIGRARKILVVKYKQKSRYLRRNGHRQPFFKVKITSIK
jgi:large subunit ribosomal protein L21